MDKKSLITLEFDKVRAILAEYSSFSAGQQLALDLMPTTERLEAELWQAQTAEAVALFEKSSEVTIGGARDVRQSVDNAERGLTIPAEDLLYIRATIVSARTLRRQLLKGEETYPNLAEIAELIEECPGIVMAIGNTIDERGEVLDSASQKLAKIRQELRSTHARIQDKLQKLLNSSANQWLQESLITMRSGRYVLPLRAEAKGRIRGIVHDHSGSGATLFVEPLNTVELNNDYRSLQIKEQDEIMRILAALSAQIAEQGDAIKRVVERMAEMDLIFARGRYASVIGGVQPEFVPWRQMPPLADKSHNPHPGSTLWIAAARHPLLEAETVIPTDFLVKEDIFHVLITGPNTGGKTVSLKNLGLMVLMAQSGMHLPAAEAKLTVFSNVFADIGDEQSIEQSLSTFSGHITNIIHILDNVDSRSLVVFDELGSGTDPAEGAAIAQAIVNFLRDKGATTFVATHYPELKVYASQTPGVTNASLLFDDESLSPTYEMTIGLPGRSNATAIARRLGLDETIIHDALGLLGQGNNDATSMLESIYDLREKMLTEEAATRLANQEADEARDSLLRRLNQIEVERDQVLAEARAEAASELDAVRSEIKEMRRKLRDAASLTAARQVSRRIEALADDVKEQEFEADKATAARSTDAMVPTAKAANNRRDKRKNKLAVGDTVLVKTLGVKGQIISIDKREVAVAVGRLHMRATLQELEYKGPSKEDEEQVETARSSESLFGHKSPGMELDLRGKRVDEGLRDLERYLDAAYLANLPFVRVIHGKGTGRMREAVRKALKKREDIAVFAEASHREGGSGVTEVKFG